MGSNCGLVTDSSQNMSVRTHLMNSDSGFKAILRAKLDQYRCTVEGLSGRNEKTDWGDLRRGLWH